MAKILVVDDDAANRGPLVTLLGYRGHTLFQAEGASPAMTLIRREHPDLLIVDIQMPGTNGYEFARQVRREPDIPPCVIMFYTATYDPIRAQVLADEFEAPPILTKPIDPETLGDIVAAALRTRASSRAPDSSSDFDLSHLKLVADKLNEKVRRRKQE